MTAIHNHPKFTYANQYFDETGPSRAPYLICKGLVASGWDVDIIAIANDGNARLESAWNRVPVHKVNGSSKYEKLLRLSGSLLRRRKNHLVMSAVWDWHCFALAISRILFGSPYALHLDTYTFKTSKSFRGRFAESLRFGMVMSNASVIFANTPACYEQTKRYFKNPKVLLVPEGLWQKDLQAIEDVWEAEGFRPEREPTVLYAGRLIERKNVHDLISAFIQVADRFPEWKLEIRGPATSPEYYARLKQLVQSSGQSHRIHFEPSLPGEALYRRYREVSIYCLPSEGEGTPTTIVETMYFGGAIIAGDSGYVNYQLNHGECGLLHAPRDVETLSAHLARLMASQQEREHFMHKARERMTNTFTWECYFDVIDDLFQRVATMR